MTFNSASLVVCAFTWLLCHSIRAAEHQDGRQLGVQSIDVYANDSRIHLLAGESHDPNSRSMISHRLSIDGGETWSEPVRIDAGLPAAHSLHRGMDAQIAAWGII